MYSKGDIGKISPVVSQTCNYKRTTAFVTLKNPLGELQYLFSKNICVLYIQ